MSLSMRICVSILATLFLFVPARAEDQRPADERDSFIANGYLGVGVDNFAAGEVKTYLNPGDANDIETRGIAGFDFAYRLWDQHRKHNLQLWIYGETVHGVRSAEVDCTKNP